MPHLEPTGVTTDGAAPAENSDDLRAERGFRAQKWLHFGL